MLALIIAILGQIELWSNSIIRPHAPAAVLFYLVMAGGVEFRRRSPLAAPVATTLAGNIAFLVGVPLNQMLVPVIAFLIVAYSLGAHTPRQMAIGGLILVLGLVWAGIAYSSQETGLGDYLFSGLQLCAAWGAGRAVRYRLHQAVDAERRTVEMEYRGIDLVRDAVSSEGVRIARELHDIVSHGLSPMVIQSGAAEQVIASDQTSEIVAVRSIGEVGRAALTEMQRLLNVLRLDGEEDDPEPRPSLAQLDSLVERMRIAGLRVEMQIDGLELELPLGIQLCVYRLVQEALTNSLKHSSNSGTVIRLRYCTESLEVEVVDEGGRGSDPLTPGGTV